MLFLLLMFTVTNCDAEQIRIVEATASGVGYGCPASLAIDGDNFTFYHSEYGPHPKWLKLELEYLSFVKTISVVNR